jgi:hypothetical protein
MLLRIHQTASTGGVLFERQASSSSWVDSTLSTCRCPILYGLGLVFAPRSEVHASTRVIHDRETGHACQLSSTIAKKNSYTVYKKK